MPVFTFSGKDASGQKITGERVAPNKQTLSQALRRERITPGAIREKGKEFAMPTFGSGKIKVKDVAVFFRQFSVMIGAGLALVRWAGSLAAHWSSHDTRSRSDFGERHAPVPQGFRCPHHQHDRGRRHRRYSRHHSAAP